MRSSIIFMKWARSPQNEKKVPFKVDMPMKLRNHVSGKAQRVTNEGCLQQATLLLACLEKNNMENSMCTKETTDFQNCYKTYLSNKRFEKQQALEGTVTPGVRNLRYKQLNQLLKKYPQVN